MVARIFSGFTVILTAGILLMLPFTPALYDFKTDHKEDVRQVSTGVGVTTGNTTLAKAVYQNDTSTLEVVSNDANDTPVLSSYNGTTRVVVFSGLSANTTRSLTITYDTYALSAYSAIDTFVSRFDLLWIVGIVAFICAGVVVLFIAKD